MGCALRISLTDHFEKLYSTDVIFENRADAQKECAREAIEKGVLEFIKFGNRQTEPAPKKQDEPGNSDQQMSKQGESSRPSLPAKGISLQTFFDSLPQPLPEHLPDKPANEINSSGWLNTTLQQARGAKLFTQFHYFSEGKGKQSCTSRHHLVESIYSYIY